MDWIGWRSESKQRYRQIAIQVANRGKTVIRGRAQPFFANTKEKPRGLRERGTFVKKFPKRR